MKILPAILLLLFASTGARAQDVIRQAPCNNDLIRHQADSIKQDFAAKGFIVLKESSVTMESEYEMPVIVPLTKSMLYQFVFIGDITSRLFEVRMYDWNENQVFYQKNVAKDADANIIIYPYVPSSSEYHMVKPLQVNRKKKTGLCGYIMMLKKVR